MNNLNSKLRIIFLSPYLPAIDTSACAKVVYNNIRFLYERGYTIYLFTFCSIHDQKKIDAIKPYCKQLYLEIIRDYSCYPSKVINLTQKIRSLIKNAYVDILQCENAFLTRYIPKDIDISLILREHEILSVLFYSRINFEERLANKIILYFRAFKKRFIEEKHWYVRYKKIIVFSEYDKNILRKLYNIKNIEVIPLGIDLTEYPARDIKNKIYDIIFVGNFSHSPNVDAVLYFYKYIMPLLKKSFPAVSVVIVGVNPPESIKRLSNLYNNTFVTGYVNDITEYYNKSKVFIAPIRYGTGMRVKVLEALVARIPVISTSVGARGIIIKENIKIVDTEKEFADTIIGLLNSPDKYENLAKNGRTTVEKYYNWDTLLDKYENIYYSLLE